MNLKFIFVFYLCRIINVVLSIEDNFECVKRKSGTCKAFDVSQDFDRFIDLKLVEQSGNTIIEFDYTENKHSYGLEQNKKKKGFDTFDNPVIEILFSEKKDPEYSYRLGNFIRVNFEENGAAITLDMPSKYEIVISVLGEKVNRLAYLEVVENEQSIIYNNYTPDLPSWPFAINVTIKHPELMVNTKDGDGFDNPEPFLQGSSGWISVTYMSVRNRNKNVNIVGFYDCSTKYGANCGLQKTETITDCRAKFSPLGSGLFLNFVDLTKFNRLNTGNELEFEMDEIFGVYRRNNDSCVILFSPRGYERGTYVRITIGDEISVRVRTLIGDTDTYYEKDAVMKGWNQEPSHPNFIRIKISSVTKEVSIYKIKKSTDDVDGGKPILTMKLCNYFERYSKYLNSIGYMSVTSNRFKTVDLYYDCCLPHAMDDCHVYEKNKDTRMETVSVVSTTEDSQNISDSKPEQSVEDLNSTTIQPEDDSTTIQPEEEDSTTIQPEEDSTTMQPEEDSTTMQPEEDLTTMQPEENLTAIRPEEVEIMETSISKDAINETERIVNGSAMTKTFLDTSGFGEPRSTTYFYSSGSSTNDYCPSEIADGVKLQEITEAPATDYEEDEEAPYHSLPSRGGGFRLALASLVG